MLIRKSFQFRLRPQRNKPRRCKLSLTSADGSIMSCLSNANWLTRSSIFLLSKYQQSMFLPLLKDRKTCSCSSTFAGIAKCRRSSGQSLSGIFSKMQGRRKARFSAVSRCPSDTIAFAIRKADFPLLAKNSNFRNSALFASRCIVP